MNLLQWLRQSLIEFKTDEIQQKLWHISMNELDAMVGFERPELAKINIRPELWAIKKQIQEILLLDKNSLTFVFEYTDIMKMPDFNNKQLTLLIDKYNTNKISNWSATETKADLKYLIYYFLIFKKDFSILAIVQNWIETEFAEIWYSKDEDVIIDTLKRIVFLLKTKNVVKTTKQILDIEKTSSYIYLKYLSSKEAKA